jgi:hypothetical protein
LLANASFSRLRPDIGAAGIAQMSTNPLYFFNIYAFGRKTHVAQ